MLTLLSQSRRPSYAISGTDAPSTQSLSSPSSSSALTPMARIVSPPNRSQTCICLEERPASKTSSESIYSGPFCRTSSGISCPTIWAAPCSSVSRLSLTRTTAPSSRGKLILSALGTLSSAILPWLYAFRKDPSWKISRLSDAPWLERRQRHVIKLDRNRHELEAVARSI